MSFKINVMRTSALRTETAAAHGLDAVLHGRERATKRDRRRGRLFGTRGRTTVGEAKHTEHGRDAGRNGGCSRRHCR